jgi:DNA polymerase elongation subunit (family B)
MLFNFFFFPVPEFHESSMSGKAESKQNIQEDDMYRFFFLSMTIADVKPKYVSNREYMTKWNTNDHSIYQVPDKFFNVDDEEEPLSMHRRYVPDSIYYMYMFGKEAVTHRKVVLHFPYWRSFYVKTAKWYNETGLEQLKQELVAEAARKGICMNYRNYKITVERHRDMQGHQPNAMYYEFKKKSSEKHNRGDNPHPQSLLHLFIHVRSTSPAIYSWLLFKFKYKPQHTIAEDDIPISQEFMVAHDIKPSHGVAIPRADLSQVSDYRVSHAEVEYLVQIPKDWTLTRFQSCELPIPPLRIASFDGEMLASKKVEEATTDDTTETSLPTDTAMNSADSTDDDDAAQTELLAKLDSVDNYRFPNAKLADDEVMVIATVVKDTATDEEIKAIHCLGPANPVADASVEMYIFDKEGDALNAWRDFIIKQDVDIITGWNINGFDWPYLAERMARLGPNDRFWFISTLIKWPCRLQDRVREIPGRQNIDLCQWARENKQGLPDHTLNTAAWVLCERKKLDMDIADMFRRRRSVQIVFCFWLVLLFFGF